MATHRKPLFLKFEKIADIEDGKGEDPIDLNPNHREWPKGNKMKKQGGKPKRIK